MSADKTLLQLLQSRKEKGLLRQLRTFPASFVDFSSNDYLGFSFTGLLQDQCKEMKTDPSSLRTGSGGSRLLAGNSDLAVELEREIAAHHHSESALLFNSGYDANLGFFSCVPQKGDLIFYDELVHASIIDGIGLSLAKAFKFQHNNLVDLEKKIALQTGKNIFIAVESLYSMDGDFAPLKELAVLCAQKGYNLVVDEAHATGIYGEKGSGLCNEMKMENACFARIYTFGKALGTHGAAVCGSIILSEFLINFSRPFIFSTSLPFHSLVSIQAAYRLLGKNADPVKKIMANITCFREQFKNFPGYRDSNSPIQAIVIPGNAAVQQTAEALNRQGFDVRAVKSPTVKEGSERLRISLHAHNTAEEINRLFLALSSAQNLPV
jgi:8-amino-7-oxononanoate synthase